MGWRRENSSWSGYGQIASSCEYSNEPLDCIKYRKYPFSENNLSASDLFYLYPGNFNKILSIAKDTKLAKHNKTGMET
jgi:hypothetical protein